MQITKELLLWQSLADCVESTLLHAMAEAASGGHEALVRLCYEGWGEKIRPHSNLWIRLWPRPRE